MFFLNICLFAIFKSHRSMCESICFGIRSRFECEFLKHYFVKILANAQSISCVFASHCFKNSTPKIGTTKTKAKLLLFRGGRVQQYEVLQDRQQRKSLILLGFGDLRGQSKRFAFGYPLRYAWVRFEHSASFFSIPWDVKKRRPKKE